MSWLKTVGEELAGLFVDDVWLSAGVLAWVVVPCLSFPHLLPAGWDGVVFLFGIAGLVVATALRSAGPR